MSNARAVADSLNHYEFLKVRVGQIRTDLQQSQTEKLGLKIQLIRANARVDSVARTAADLPTVKAKLKASRAENWTWRGVAALALLKFTADIVGLLR